MADPSSPPPPRTHLYSLRSPSTPSKAVPTTPKPGPTPPSGELPRYPSRLRVSITVSPKKRQRDPDPDDPGGDDVIAEFRKLKADLTASRSPNRFFHPDQEAYRVLRDRHGIVRRSGPVGGVSVGDTFECRAELSLVGLHCQMETNIDYIRSPHPVAVSIVTTSAPDSDILICCGCGTQNRDQRMDDRNSSMVNCITDKKPVRVIHEGTNYVYRGLYTVERYWEENFGFRLFMFQLRKVPGQPEIVEKCDAKEQMLSPKTKSKPETVMKKCEAKEQGLDLKSTSEPNIVMEKFDVEKQASSSETTSEVLHSDEPLDAPEDEVVGEPLDTPEDEDMEMAPLAYEYSSCCEKGKHGGKLVEALQELRELYDMLAIIGSKKKPKLRVDLAAFNLYKDRKNELSFMSKCIGEVPGVDIGDTFSLRVELSLIGLHHSLQGDIDYVRAGERNIAVSVISSHSVEQYSELANSNILLCRGSGDTYSRCQNMEDEDLAMKNNIETRDPVRVIHAFKSRKKIKIYVYGGMYNIQKQWKEKGENGYYYCMFQLRRVPGQFKLDIDMDIDKVRKMKNLKPCSPDVITDDISIGKEKIPIRAVNTIDDEKPPSFVYITKLIRPPTYDLAPSEGCNCVNGCSDSDDCACAVKNGGELPYNDEGLLVHAKPLFYECGPSCKCPPTCHNRVSQQGIMFPLEVFKTEMMGWGLRSRTFIPSGSFICEYIGELLEDEEATKRNTDVYLFAIGNNFYNESLWEGLSSIPCLKKDPLDKVVEDGGFTIDAANYGNIGRYMNHHCSPNVFAQNLIYDHDDKRMPRVAFFARDDIPPLQELTYDYNYTIGDVHDSEGNVKEKKCYCGSDECSGRLY